MSPEDLLKEIRQQENAVVKLRLGVKLGKEKDSAKYIREKKQLARMKTVHSPVSSTSKK
jgi:ribosomal protein L29